MLRARIIPTLLIRDKGLVKTVNFKNERYIGDPLNAVKIFNEKEADEIIVLDIDATLKNKEPDYTTIERIARECRMPLCYGGGVKNSEQAQRIFSLGVEKIAVSSEAIYDPNKITQIAEQVGNQSVALVLDVKQKKNLLGKITYQIWTHNGTKNTQRELVEFIMEIKDKGIGEIIINSIDRDGMISGYDLNLIETVKKNINTPVTCIGGAGSFDDIKQVVQRFGILGVAAGSLFVFKGPLKAVLINYPDTLAKKTLTAK